MNTSTNQQQQGTGLFGGGGTTGGGLFGNSTNPPQQMQNPGLFGGASTLGGGGGLFGQTSTTQQQQPQTGMIGSSLFQNKPQQIQPTQQGGLFGTQAGFGNAQFPQQSGLTSGTSGIIGTQPSTTGGGSIFGGGGSSLFGGGQGQQQPQQQQPQSFGLFGQQQAQPQQTFQQGQPQQSSIFSQGFGQTQAQPQTQPVGLGSGFGQSSFLGGLGQGQQTGQSMGQGLGLGLGQTGQGLGQQSTGFGGFGQQTSNIGLGQQSTGVGLNQQTGGLFGQHPQQQSTGSIFGLQQTGLGIQQQQQPQQTGMFGGGGTGSLFGGLGAKPSTTTTTTGGLGFGMTTTQTSFTGTHKVAYQPFKATEQANLNGQTKIETIYLISISAMNEFNKKSVEELRYEDYTNKKQGLVTPGQYATPTGMTTGITSGLQGSTSTSGLFPSTQTGGVFGQQQHQKSLFAPTGQAPTPTGTTGLLGQSTTGGGLFGGTSFGQQQQGLTGQQPGGLFGATTSTTTTAQPLGGVQQGLGGGLFGKPQQTGGLFSTVSQPQQQQQQQQQGPTSGLFQSNIMSPAKPTTGQTSLLGQQPTGGGLFGATTGTTSNLFGGGQTVTQLGGGLQLGGQPGGLQLGAQSSGTQLGATATATTTGGSLFGGTTKPQTGLFSTQPTTTTNAGGQSLFSGIGGMSTTQGATQKPQELFSSTATPSYTTGAPLFNRESTTYKNFLDSFLTKQRTITDILNDLQRQYLEQDFFLDEYAKRERQSREINLGESKYAYAPYYPDSYRPRYQEYDYRERVDPYESFLKSKRTFNYPSKQAESGKTNQSLYRPEDQMSSGSKKKNLLDFEFTSTIRNKPERREEREAEDGRILKKSHSCDLIKKNEAIVVKNLGESFDQKVNLEDEFGSVRQKKISENILLELYICLQEPIKLNFKLKINKNSKISVLKNAIVDQLKERNPKMFKKLNTNSFVLMKKYSIIKEGLLLYEAEIKDGDTIHILLKENFNPFMSGESTKNKVDNGSSVSVSRKESKAEKKKKKLKSELAPLDKLPSLTKTNYKTIPDFRNISRMTLDELENVENFSIYNEHGRIDFEGKVDLTNLNLDQIVNIEEKRITVYQNGDLDFKPPMGQGLNKPAILHLYNCFPSDGKKTTDEQLDVYLSSLQKICKDKGAEFKSYDKNTGEWIFRVDHFI